MTLRAFAFASLAAVGCGSCGGAQEGAELEVPEALADLAEYAEVVPFDDWSVPGVTLYRATWSVPDQSNHQIVGVDESGARIDREDLMARFGELSARELATRAFGVLLGDHGAEPLTAADRDSIAFGTDDEWALIEPPRREGGDVVFFALEGEMDPMLVEHRLDPETFDLVTRTVAEMVQAQGDAETGGEPRCVAYTSCGCWRGCVRVREVRDAEGTVFRVVDGEHAGAELVHREDCFEERCFVSCSEDSSGISCEDGAYELSQTCTGSCAPSQAPYRCRMDEDGCRSIDHPL